MRTPLRRITKSNICVGSAAREPRASVRMRHVFAQQPNTPNTERAQQQKTKREQPHKTENILRLCWFAEAKEARIRLSLALSLVVVGRVLSLSIAEIHNTQLQLTLSHIRERDIITSRGARRRRRRLWRVFCVLVGHGRTGAITVLRIRTPKRRARRLFRFVRACGRCVRYTVARTAPRHA